MTEKIDKNLKTLLFVLIALLFIVVLFLFSANTVSKNSQSGRTESENKTSNVNENSKREDGVQDKNEDSENISYSYSENDKESTVFFGLLNYGKENNIEIKYNNDYDFGVFIESVGGIKSGDDGKSWMYYVNGVLGDVAADKKILEAGDRVEWRFEKIVF